MPRAKKITEEPVAPLNPAFAVENPVQPHPVQMKPVVPKQKVVLKNTSGEDMDMGDYFYNSVVPPQFNKVCGMPVDREELVDIFNNIIDPKYNFLFYRALDKEVYLIIVPLKNSTSVGATHESIDGDFQKHAISFISEGSVNGDTLKMKLRRILPFVKLGDN